MIYIFSFSILMIIYPLVIYPVLLLGLSRFFKEVQRQEALAGFPIVSIIVIVRNGEKGIGEKIKNCLALDYPKERLEIVIASDGQKTELSRLRSL